jgi:hypothetical protein
MAAQFHLAKDALPLHLLLQRLESLIDIIVADENLHACFLLEGEEPEIEMNEHAALAARLAERVRLNRRA